MKDIIQEVFSLGFKEKPRYDTIRQMFQKNMEETQLLLGAKPQIYSKCPISRPTSLYDMSISEEFLHSINKIQKK